MFRKVISETTWTREVLKSKLHRAVITEADVEYEGSIEIPRDLMDAADLWPGEKVLPLAALVPPLPPPSLVPLVALAPPLPPPPLVGLARNRWHWPLRRCRWCRQGPGGTSSRHA
jgi:hypothetical protein